MTANAHADYLKPSRLALFFNCGGSRLWFGGDGNIHLSNLFELHIIAMFVS